MKRIISLLLTAVIASGMLVGCGSSSAPAPAPAAPAPAAPAAPAPAAPAPAPAPAPAAKDKYRVGFSQVGSETEWRIAMSKEVQDSFAASDKFELIFSDAQQKQENQIAAMRSFIQQQVDAIMLCPVVATGWDAVMTEAQDAGIPVVIVNRRATMSVGDIEDYSLCYIGPDNIYAGELAAEIMVDLFKDEAGPVNLVLLEGTVGASSAVDRSTGIDNVLSKQDKLVVYAAQSGDYNRSKAKEVMESIIKSAQAAGVTINAVLGHADDMNIGASQALEEAGMRPGTDVKLVGIDGVKVAFEAMVEGKYNATVENPQGYGATTIEVLTDYFENNKQPEEWVKLLNQAFLQDEAAAALPNRTF